MTIFLIIGNITQPNNLPLPNKNSEIYMLDIKSYTWIYTFDAPSTTSTSTTSTTTSTSIPSAGGNPPIPTSTPINSSESNKQLATMKVVIAAIGSILGTVVLIAIGFFGYKCYQRRRPSGVMRVHGNVLTG